MHCFAEGFGLANFLEQRALFRGNSTDRFAGSKRLLGARQHPYTKGNCGRGLYLLLDAAVSFHRDTNLPLKRSAYRIPNACELRDRTHL